MSPTSTNQMAMLTAMYEFFMGGHTLEQLCVIGHSSPTALREQRHIAAQFHSTTAAIVRHRGSNHVKARSRNARRRFVSRTLKIIHYSKANSANTQRPIVNINALSSSFPQIPRTLLAYTKRQELSRSANNVI